MPYGHRHNAGFCGSRPKGEQELLLVVRFLESVSLQRQWRVSNEIVRLRVDVSVLNVSC